jgi:hypothetical protein
MEWKIDDSEGRLTELLETVDEQGPQQIRHRGKVYIISPGPPEEKSPRNRLVEIITNGPSWEGIDIKRMPGKMREVDL